MYRFFSEKLENGKRKRELHKEQGQFMFDPQTIVAYMFGDGKWWEPITTLIDRRNYYTTGGKK